MDSAAMQLDVVEPLVGVEPALGGPLAQLPHAIRPGVVRREREQALVQPVHRFVRVVVVHHEAHVLHAGVDVRLHLCDVPDLHVRAGGGHDLHDADGAHGALLGSDRGRIPGSPGRPSSGSPACTGRCTCAGTPRSCGIVPPRPSTSRPSRTSRSSGTSASARCAAADPSGYFARNLFSSAISWGLFLRTIIAVSPSVRTAAAVLSTRSGYTCFQNSAT